MPMVRPNDFVAGVIVAVAERAGAQGAVAFADTLDQTQHHAEHMFGDGFGIAARLIDDQDTVVGAVLDGDGVVAGAVGGDDQEVWRLFQTARR